MRKHLPTIVLIFLLIIGLSLVLYPSISNYINSLHQTQSIASYEDKVLGMNKDAYNEYKQQARDYNEKITAAQQHFVSGEPKNPDYKKLLNISGNDMMGYITIDKINVQLPVYHGTSESVLANGAGHLEGSSLPVGGKGTHCVLTGHRGMVSSKLFTDINKLDTGDTFTISVLDEMLTYEVDNIAIVEPDDDRLLKVVEGQDYVTLVTCTPYGVNTHRILVRGKRIENTSSLRVTSDAVQIDTNITALFFALPAILLFVVIITIKGRIHKK
ncbi:MAG: class C sortase [Acutalibacteraceae bacterium]